MKTLYLLTGAAGYLGSAVLDELLKHGRDVRVLVLPGDRFAADIPEGVETLFGDVTDREGLRRFFRFPADAQAVVIHVAGIVTIYPGFNRKVQDVNVEGTRNVVDLCVETGVKKLVYVSSVHAIPELPRGDEMREVTDFSPDRVEGFYARTKAMASAIVTDAVRRRGLDASIVFPSGLCGPGDRCVGSVTQMLIDCVRGKLPAGVDGGYDFADVRDVAAGILAAADRGGRGENYILGNRYVSVREILRTVHELSGSKLVRRMLPVPVLLPLLPFFRLYYKIRKRPPVITRYSLSTLRSNSRFSSAKARLDLGYTTRPFRMTVSDTLEWLRRERKL